ncbi:hypothetical protein [Kitasatospora sp. NPDC058218]|uniref:hypothetical protein n=1 Tax=Kitasatospora sp. NPDC058218 TaxID=3346385 RepID=UPI0036DCA13F
MQIERTPHERGFVIIPNGIAQSDELSLTEIGLLVRLLSQPNGTSETVRSLTENVAEGQARVTKAMKGVQAAGYVVCTKVQNDQGHWSTHVAVYDRPQTGGPKDETPQPGKRRCRIFGTNPEGKNQEKNPTPTPVAEEAVLTAEVEEGREGIQQNNEHQDQATADAAAVLGRVGQIERRLRLGVPEMLRLAPLAAEWVARGATEAEIRDALVSGLPAKVARPAAIVEWRLTNKMPAVLVPAVPVVPLVECGQCKAPLPRGQEAGICGPCAGVAPRATASIDSLDWRDTRNRPGLVSPAAGVARARAALGL